ncbi:MAG: enoyl-CoA hydratase/isomerase family protein [Novosphingobium sp.]|nr:enoyl-CoA hydratase/isomerase family protein [Novosphingobium sp.]
MTQLAVTEMAGLSPTHFLWEMRGRVACIRLDRPERKNPLTFDSYAELRDVFRALAYADDVDAVVILPNGGNFCSGGDVHDIIGPLVGMEMKQLLAFTRMTGDLVKAMLHCGKPITGRTMSAEEGERWGFYNRLVEPETLEAQAVALATRLAEGPTFAHGITKTQLNQEWSMGIDQAIEAEAQAQAICMQTRDFERAYRAFVAKRTPVFEGD